MPNLNQHSARMGPPDQFSDIKTRPTATPGVTVLVGLRRDGDEDVESIRFDADRFTPKQAQEWLRAKGKHPIAFEPASAIPNRGEGMSGQRRAAARMVEQAGKHRSETAAMMAGDKAEWAGEDGDEKPEPPTDSDLAADAAMRDARKGKGKPKGKTPGKGLPFGGKQAAPFGRKPSPDKAPPV